MDCFTSIRVLLGLAILSGVSAQTTDDVPEDVLYYTTTYSPLQQMNLDDQAVGKNWPNVDEREANKKLLTEASCAGKTIFTSGSGDLYSPNFPENYPNNVTCIWKIHAPKDHHIYLYFHQFHIEEGVINSALGPFASPECHFDMLYIIEIPDKTESGPRSKIQLTAGETSINRHKVSAQRKVWGIFCGNRIPPPRMTETPGGELIIVFHSDESKTKRGFWASFHSLPADEFRNLVKHGRNEADSNTKDGFLDPESWEGEEGDMKKAYASIMLFVFTVVLVLMILHCWQGPSTCDTQYCGRRTRPSDSIPSVLMNMFGGGGQDSGAGQTTPPLPTPPPEYGEIIKTEEDWRQALERIGETEESMERYRSLPDNLQTEYDLNASESDRQDHSLTSSQTRITVVTSDSSSLPMYDPRSGVTDNYFIENENLENVPVPNSVATMNPERTSA